MLRSIACIPVLLTAAAAAVGQAPDAALKHLTEMLGEQVSAKVTLVVLRATKDPHVLPLFVAASRSADKEQRLFATVALREIGQKSAAEALFERLRNDPLMIVRAEALVQLLRLDAISPEQLIETLKTSDENIRCIACRALVQRGRGMDAARMLHQLARSKDLATACMARMSLLVMGYTEPLEELGKVMRSSETPPEVVSLILEQIREDKVAAALPLAEHVAKSGPSRLRIRAYRALAAISSRATGTLYDAIGKSDKTVFRVGLLRMLSDRPDAREKLEALSTGRGAVSLLAKFELARNKGGFPAANAADKAIKLGHPVVINYVLDRAAGDIAKRRDQVSFYAAPLLTYVRSVSTNPKSMGAEHRWAASAATLLADLGSPQAIAGLKSILTGRYSAITRTAGAGLLRSKNSDVCDLAQPLLKSPYGELVQDAALVMGRFADPRAKPYLLRIVTHPRRHPKALTILSSWYLLRIAGRTQQAGKQLANILSR